MAQVTTVRNRGRYVGVVDLIGLVGVGLGLFFGGLLYDGGEGYLNGNLWYLAAGFILAGVPLIHFTLRHLDGDAVVVLSHGGPIRCMLAEILGMRITDLFRLRVDLGGVSVATLADSGDVVEFTNFKLKPR